MSPHLFRIICWTGYDNECSRGGGGGGGGGGFGKGSVIIYGGG
jgi:hypothetical protein